MENDTIWKVGLVVLVLLVVVGIYNNNNRFTEEVTGEAIGDSITGMVTTSPYWNYNKSSDTIYTDFGTKVGIGTSDVTSNLNMYKLKVRGGIRAGTLYASDAYIDNWVKSRFLKSDSVYVNELNASNSGIGNGYVCADYMGKLYKRNISCV